MKYLLSGIIASLFALAAVPYGNAATKPAVEIGNMRSGVMYATGGIGQDSVNKVRELARDRDFNVQLSFAWKAGNFIAGIPVTIRNANGRQVLALASSDPLLLVRLPAGRYTATAVYQGKTIKRTIEAPHRGMQVVHFSWQKPTGSLGMTARK